MPIGLAGVVIGIDERLQEAGSKEGGIGTASGVIRNVVQQVLAV